MNRPWLKFYPSDWRGDPRLRMCSLSARGLWIDLISYMHEGQPYGHLTIDGIAPDIDSISSLVARPPAEVKKALAELESKKVFSRTRDKIIFSRRMVADHQRSLEGKKHISKRWATSDPIRSPTTKASTQSPESRVDGGGDARASVISPDAFALAAEIRTIAGISGEMTPPGWCGAPMIVQKWLNEGWSPDIVRVACQTAMAAKRDGPPSTIAYFEKAVARAVAQFGAPLPQVVTSSPEVIHAQATRHQPGGSVLDAIDRLEDKMRSGGGDGTNSHPVRSLSKG